VLPCPDSEHKAKRGKGNNTRAASSGWQGTKTRIGLGPWHKIRALRAGNTGQSYCDHGGNGTNRVKGTSSSSSHRNATALDPAAANFRCIGCRVIRHGAAGSTADNCSKREYGNQLDCEWCRGNRHPINELRDGAGHKSAFALSDCPRGCGLEPTTALPNDVRAKLIGAQTKPGRERKAVTLERPNDGSGEPTSPYPFGKSGIP
jgi:hypothetical protein